MREAQIVGQRLVTLSYVTSWVGLELFGHPGLLGRVPVQPRNSILPKIVPTSIVQKDYFEIVFWISR